MSGHSAGLCPRYHQAVELVGRRWAGAIVQILLAGPARYNELRSAIPDINDRMLAERLRELEAEQIVIRTVLPEAPVRVEYTLTEKGRALEGALTAIGRWAERWIERPAPTAAAPAATKTAVPKTAATRSGRALAGRLAAGSTSRPKNRTR
jgi:DNA-binding HxlR family transcriptional regulator